MNAPVITQPIGGTGHGRFAIVRGYAEGLLIARAATTAEACAIREAWRHNDFTTWPGEWRPFSRVPQ